MSAISFIAPYAPQPVAPSQGDPQVAGLQASQPLANTSSGSNAGSTSDHSGQGAGDGTGTGGAQLATLLKRGRVAMLPVEASSKSVIDAQTRPTIDYLAQQAQLRAESAAIQEARAAARAQERAEAMAQAAADAAKPEYDLPNPLPTAPILERDDA
ncbi:hypothetical protein KX928_18530 [Roseobacter sp. YSTF-M11]|uniref:Uncharacterized protein n=1 Tax=Roseobacter insulae TaxID=2859783 RepID=A0A9X1FYP5_9RHOB|nr:hypothetical protein [Roseobacter insulae]MBW4709789.1 hypothetical protein [Roseobacter insulae]